MFLFCKIFYYSRCVITFVYVVLDDKINNFMTRFFRKPGLII